MARSRSLKSALDHHKGVDYAKERQRKLQKEAERRKRKTEHPEEYFMSGALSSEPRPDAVTHNEDEDRSIAEKANGEATKEDNIWETEDEDEVEDEGRKLYDISRLAESESSSDEDDDNGHNGLAEKRAVNGGSNFSKAEAGTNANNEDGEELEGEEEDEEDDIPLSDIASIASDEKGDIVPHQRLTINNVSALVSAHKRIALPLSSMPFSTHQSITTDEPVTIADVNDDLQREKEFLRQSLHAVREARRLLKAENVPFSRPSDYFAEMVKSDEHMGRVRQKLVDAAASKKAAQEARKQRDLKKFGKQVQIAKLQERSKEKRETLDKINLLKRKRANAQPTTETEPDLFDVELDNEDSRRKRPDGAPLDANKRQKLGAGAKRAARDAKYGFGGKKRHAKSGDAFSSADMSSYPGRAMKAKGPAKKSKFRPGKSKRAKGRP